MCLILAELPHAQFKGYFVFGTICNMSSSLYGWTLYILAVDMTLQYLSLLAANKHCIIIDLTVK